MAVNPSNSALATWFGAGSGIGATTTTAGSHWVISKTNLARYVGNDAVIADDVRDFIFSILSKCADECKKPLAEGETRPTSITVVRSLDTTNNRAVFSVVLNGLNVTVPQAVEPYATSLPMFS